MKRSTEWFQQYLPQLTAFGFKPDWADTDPDGGVTSFNSVAASAAEVKSYFKAEGFVNLDKRTYMAHTGNPHINLYDAQKNTVQISWFPKGGMVGVSFLGGAL